MFTNKWIKETHTPSVPLLRFGNEMTSGGSFFGQVALYSFNNREGGTSARSLVKEFRLYNSPQTHSFVTSEKIPCKFLK